MTETGDRERCQTEAPACCSPRAAWTGFIRAATTIAQDGSFAGFDGITPYDELNRFFHDDLQRLAS